MKFSYGDQDPIAALATAPGQSALAVIRTSGKTPDGKTSIDLTAGVFSRPARLGSAAGNSVVHGWIVDPFSKKKIDEVLISVFRSPKSFTGEDCTEICCHGGAASVKAVMSVLKKAGFREALPGEFSFRSFMNGKTDLTRAESVMEIVSAKSGRARERAVQRLSGILEKEISGIKNLLVQVLAGTEIYLDYSEDEFSVSAEDEAAGRLPDRALAETAAEKLAALAELWRRERVYAEGALAVIAGRPNAGKSSLFNYLLREDRSIVTDTPGTTRDWIEAVICAEDIPLRIADTAGLRNPGLADGGEAEKIGIQRSFDLLDSADLVLYVIDGTEGITAEDREFIADHHSKPMLVLWNKSDMAKPPLNSSGYSVPLNADDSFSQLLSVSAKTGEGVPALIENIVSVFDKSGTEISYGEGTGPGTVRQKELIDTALASVREALVLADNGEPLDLIAPLLRTAVDALGEITGEVTNADILEVMFGRFCVGK